MSAQRPRILFVDDDHNFRKVTAYALRDAGYTLETAADGREALAVLETCSRCCKCR